MPGMPLMSRMNGLHTDANRSLTHLGHYILWWQPKKSHISFFFQQTRGTSQDLQNIEVAEIVQYPILLWMAGLPPTEHQRLWIGG